MAWLGWLMIGIVLGFIWSSLTWWAWRRRMEANLRQLANHVAAYSQFIESKDLPADWVTDQLDTFVRQTFE